MLYSCALELAENANFEGTARHRLCTHHDSTASKAQAPCMHVLQAQKQIVQLQHELECSSIKVCILSNLPPVFVFQISSSPASSPALGRTCQHQQCELVNPGAKEYL